METAVSRPSSWSAYVRLVRTNANFRKLWIAQIISEIGDWLYTVAIYAQLLGLTEGSAKSIGFAFVLQVLPQMMTAPIAGILNDRLSRRKVMMWSDYCRAVIMLGMLLAQTREMIWFIYLLLFLETVCWGLFEPARSAVIPNITEGEETITANSLSSITWSFNFMMGFSIGGFLAATAGRQAVFVLDSLSFLASALLIRSMKFREPHQEALPRFRLRHLLDNSHVAEALRYVWSDKRLFVTMLAKFGLGFMGANWVLLTILGERNYRIQLPGIDPAAAGMIGMSLLMGSRGLGALLGPALGTWAAGTDQGRMRKGILLGFAMAAVGYVSLGWAASFAVACVALVLAHAGGSLIWVFSSTLLQMTSRDEFRGRVFSAEFSFMTISMSMSSTAAGIMIDKGYTPSDVAVYVGLAMLAPGLAWLTALVGWGRLGPR